MSNAPFKILTLDGGGIRGLFPAAFLSHLEEYTETKLIDYFDLIVGTSTGAIIALGLAAGLPAREILRFYQEVGPQVFSGGTKFPFGLFRPRYRNKRLIEELGKVFNERTLNDLVIPVCIPSYEMAEGIPRVFKDDHHKTLHWGGRLPIWKVAAASSAAPVFFPAFQVNEADSHIDGGIWANNPVLVGIVEAIKIFNQTLSDIAVLSIGTGSAAFRLSYPESKSLGLLGWGWNLRFLQVVFAAQSQAAHEAAKLLIRPGYYIRIDAPLEKPLPLDNYGKAEVLIERGRQAARRSKVEIEALFLAQLSRKVGLQSGVDLTNDPKPAP